MDKSFHQVKVCLETYLNRGRAAISCLQNDQPDEALEILKWRRAAYHNFRAIDKALSAKHADYLNQSSFSQLWQDIQQVDKILEEQIQRQLTSIKSALVQTRMAKDKIQRFHSGYRRRPDFQGIG